MMREYISSDFSQITNTFDRERLIKSFLAIGIFFIWTLIVPTIVFAAECGINIDPANPGGYPSPESIAGVGWVRIEYKDCTTVFPPEESVDTFRGVLSAYKQAGIKTLLILDYLTYPEAANNIEEFGKRVAYIDQELGGLIDAYQVWNEPDHCAQYCLDAPRFGKIAIEISRHVPTSKIVLGGFASGNPGYLLEANIPYNAYHAVGIHPYGQKIDGFWQDWQYGEMKDIVSAYKSAANGKEVWLTEIGFNTTNESPQADYNNRTLQAEYLRRVYTSDVGADKIFWFAWSDAMVSPFGLTTASQTPKNSYYEFFQHCGGNTPSTITLLPAVSPPGGQGCGGSGNSGQVDSELLIPLILQPNASQNLEDQLMDNMIVDQGYEVSCAAPELFVSNRALGQLVDYFEKNQANDYGANKLWLVSGSSVKVDFLNADIPMFRESTNMKSSQKSESYEGYFGNSIQDSQNQSSEGQTDYSVINSGVVTNLLSLSDQCMLKLESLASIEKFCNTLINSSKCALHEQIADSKYFYYSTASQDTSEPSILTAYKNSGLSCNQLMGGWEQSYEKNISRLDFNNLVDAIIATPFDFGKIYRYAFLVISPKQDTDEEELCHDTYDQRKDSFWFLRKRDDVTSDARCQQYDNIPIKHSPIVIAFKIPTFATNQIISAPLNDSGSIAATQLDGYVGQQFLKDNFGIDTSEDYSLNMQTYVRSTLFDRDDMLSRAKAKKMIAEGGDEQKKNLELVINCSGKPACDGAHGSGTELTRTLVHIINAEGNTCSPPYETIPYDPNTPLSEDRVSQILLDQDNQNPGSVFELSEEIGSSAALHNNPTIPIYLAEHYNVLNSSYSIGTENWWWGLSVDYQTAQAIRDNVDNDYNKQPVLAHIVAPLGTDLTYLETMLSSLFTQEALNQMIQENVLPDSFKTELSNGSQVERKGDIARYLPILNSKFEYDAQSWSEEYPHSTACECIKRQDCVKWNLLGECTQYEESDECEQITYHNPSGTEITEDLKRNCARSGVTLKDNYEENDQRIGFVIKGAKLGFFIRKIQTALNEQSYIHDAYEYLESCERISDLFLGKCGESNNPRYSIPGSGSCATITDPNNPCNVDNLKDKLAQYIVDNNMIRPSDIELEKRAIQASVICNAESGGNPDTLNDGCITGRSVDYSVGLFQINLLAHNCPHLFTYTWNPPVCSIVAPYTITDVETCAQPLFDADTNIRKAFQISNAGTNWWAWSTARPQHCNVCSSSGVCNGT